MLWVGLTGGLASGKSTVAKILRDQGFTVVDADELARQALSPNSEGWTKVAHHFGSEFVKENGELDRGKLAAKVFQDTNALQWLESIVHPIVGKLSEAQRLLAEQRGERLAFYDVPLLFEKNMEKRFSCVVVVNCPLETQISRSQKRDGLTREQVLSRLKNQIPLAKKVNCADFVLENVSTIEGLRLQVQQLLAQLLKTP